MPKANLWIINYCMLEIKADNEPAIRVPAYLSLSKNENLFYEKKKRHNKTKGQKQKRNKTLCSVHFGVVVVELIVIAEE